MTVINIRALTGEEIRFEFDDLVQLGSRSGPLATTSGFSDDINFVADKLNVFVTIPDHREVPKSVTLKLTLIGKTAVQREGVINCDGRVTKASVGVDYILSADTGRPRRWYKHRQKAEITLNFENRCETLTCPISGTTTFNMCFFDAYQAQGGKPVGSYETVREFPD